MTIKSEGAAGRWGRKLFSIELKPQIFDLAVHDARLAQALCHWADQGGGRAEQGTEQGMRSVEVRGVEGRGGQQGTWAAVPGRQG